MGQNENDDYTPQSKLGALDILHRDVIEVKAVLRELTLAITKLAVVEERQQQAASAQERAFRVLEAMEKRLDDHGVRMAQLEQKAKASERISRIIDLVLLGAAGVLLLTILRNTGFVTS